MVKEHKTKGFGALFKRTIAAQLHFLGLVAAIYGLIVLTHCSSVKVGSGDYIACCIYGLTSIFVFATSAIYHLLYDGFQIHPKLEKTLEDLDHFAIYFFIAGTYMHRKDNAQIL